LLILLVATISLTISITAHVVFDADVYVLSLYYWDHGMTSLLHVGLSCAVFDYCESEVCTDWNSGALKTAACLGN